MTTTTTTTMPHLLLNALSNLSSLVLPLAPLYSSTASSSSSLSPHQHRESLYELEPLISALAIFFCRFVIVTGSLTKTTTTKATLASPPHNTSTPSINDVTFSKKLAWFEFISRTCIACVLGEMAYHKMDYDIICAVHLWSHIFLPVMMSGFASRFEHQSSSTLASPPPSSSSIQQTATMKGKSTLYIILLLIISPPLCLNVCRLLSNPSIILSHPLLHQPSIQNMIPQSILQQIQSIITITCNIVQYMFPVSELQSAYYTITSFFDSNPTNQQLLHDMLCHLLFVTFHIQTGLGYIGIAFLMSEQKRKNMLIRMDIDSKNDTGVKTSRSSNSNNNAANGRKNDTQSKTKKSSDGAIVNDDKYDPSRNFRRSAPNFILLSVLPYMFQIIVFGNLNKYAFIQVRDHIHRTVRIHELFDHDSHLSALASDGNGATSPDVYASGMDTIVSTSYDIINRKLFSLPKLLILPGVISRQPMLLVKIFPFIFLTDMVKGRMVAFVTDRVEQFQREARDVNSIRQKVEQFDMKNAELLRRSRSDATQYTRRRWDELTLEYQAKMAAVDLLRRTRDYFSWLQRNFVFVALIDCALAKLLALGNMLVSEIFVFSRAIEDVVDLLLIRSRSESELATLLTQVDRLKVLDDVWSKSKEARLLPCRIRSNEIIDGTSSDPDGSIVLNNIQYSRGTASVSIEHLVIEPGIYAVTGANGSGKSTLFRLLMACNSNNKPIDLHESIQLATPIHQWDLSDNLVLPEDSCRVPDEGCMVADESEDGGMDNESSTEEIPVTSIVMPSSDIVEISQTFYWPLYSKPIDWIYQRHTSSDVEDSTESDAFVLKVAKELQLLSFAQSQEHVKKSASDVNDEVVQQLMIELQDEKEDWFSELSGGQKSKVELVRKLFVREECPSVVLIDETMAPLDPASKSQVMSKLKAFCHNSVVLIIYHTDVGQSTTTSSYDRTTSVEVEEECVPSNSFFDHNLHVVDKHLTTRLVC